MQFDTENSNGVTIKFSNGARRFLLQFKQFTTLGTKYCIDLSSQCTMWFYIQNKQVQDSEGVWKVSLYRLREIFTRIRVRPTIWQKIRTPTGTFLNT